MAKHKLIRSEAFLEWLKEGGALPEYTTHVIIEARVGQAIRIFCTGFGSEGLISVRCPSDLLDADLIDLEIVANRGDE